MSELRWYNRPSAGAMVILVAFLALVLGLASCLGAEFALPAERLASWAGYVGVEGGIPNSSNMTVYVNVTPGNMNNTYLNNAAGDVSQ